MKAFTGLDGRGPLDSIATKQGDITEEKRITEAQLSQALQLDIMLKALESMHKDVREKTSKKREAAIRSHNRKNSVRQVNFTTGDFILKGILQRQKGIKLALRWNGSYRVNVLPTAQYLRD